MHLWNTIYSEYESIFLWDSMDQDKVTLESVEDLYVSALTRVHESVFLPVEAAGKRKDEFYSLRKTMYIQINLKEPLKKNEFYSLSFQNHFSAYISIEQNLLDAKNTWQIVLDMHQIMKSPHHENDAHNYVIINKDKFLDCFDPTRLASLRVYIYQPSPMWKEFFVDNVKLYKVSNYDAEVNEPKSITVTKPSDYLKEMSPRKQIEVLSKIHELFDSLNSLQSLLKEENSFT